MVFVISSGSATNGANDRSVSPRRAIFMDIGLDTDADNYDARAKHEGWVVSILEVRIRMEV